MANIERLKPSSLEKLHEQVLDTVYYFKKNLVGRLLTIVDACVIDSEQRKSMKDLVNNAVFGDDYHFKHLGWHFEQFAQAHKLKFDRERTEKVAISADTVAEEANPYSEE